MPRNEIPFTCNLCGAPGVLGASHFENPELPSCASCLSNIRFRWIVHRLSLELFGRSTALTDFPADKSITGLGLTDPQPIAIRLAESFTYLNTFFDAAPKLDIRADPSPIGPVDFLIASEVFEHIEPPVERAFHHAAELLKPSGFLLLTVPWVCEGDGKEILPEFYDWKLEREGERWVIVDRKPNGEIERHYDPVFDGGPGPALRHTREHFPNLFDWATANGILRNTTRGGAVEEFHNLVYHGGPGLALEMRLFTRAGLRKNLYDAGFQDVEFDSQERPEAGIVFPYPWSHPVVARRHARARS